MLPFPRGLAHLIPDDLRGEVVGISLRPKRRAPTVAVDHWDLTDNQDHARSKKRAVTAISQEQLAAASALLGRDIPWQTTRRNLLIRGINPSVLKGRRVQVGQVILVGTKPCEPCSRMDEYFGRGAYAAMVGLGGRCFALEKPGIIRVGDAITLLPD